MKWLRHHKRSLLFCHDWLKLVERSYNCVLKRIHFITLKLALANPVVTYISSKNVRSKRFVFFLFWVSKDCFDSFGHLNFFFQLGLNSLFFHSPPLSISFFVFYTTEREELVQQLDKKPKSTSKEVLLSMAALLLLLLLLHTYYCSGLLFFSLPDSHQKEIAHGKRSHPK